MGWQDDIIHILSIHSFSNCKAASFQLPGYCPNTARWIPRTHAAQASSTQITASREGRYSFWLSWSWWVVCCFLWGSSGRQPRCARSFIPPRPAALDWSRKRGINMRGKRTIKNRRDFHRLPQGPWIVVGPWRSQKHTQRISILDLQVALLESLSQIPVRQMFLLARFCSRTNFQKIY